MALEAVVLSQSQQQGSSRRFGCGAMAGGPWNGLFWGAEGAVELCGAGVGSWDAAVCSSSMLLREFQEPAGRIPAAAVPPVESGVSVGQEEATAVAPVARRKRRRMRTVKNKEEVESQRMTHIAVERNRRKQMNEYLAALRSLMPPSYVQRGDQASIIGGAINYVKELEQLLQSLEARKHARRHDLSPGDGDAAAGPFAGFFTFPQYSMSARAVASSPATANTPPADGEGPNNADADANNGDGDDDASGSRPSSVADVEVTMVESHASLKLLSRRRPRQLLRLVAGLQGHRLTVLHLNATSDARRMALYSLSLKVEDDCALSSVDDIAAAVHGIVEAVDREEGGAELLGSQAEEEEEE